MKTLVKLLSKYMDKAQAGEVQWIGLRPARKEPMNVVQSAYAYVDRGLDGDRRALKVSESARQVTLINAEDILAISVFNNRASSNSGALQDSKFGIDPQLLRRNIVISGFNLHAARYQRIRVGEAVLEVGAHCHPCARMEEALGHGGFLSMYMHGGYCAKVVEEGSISLGDSVNIEQTSLLG